MCLERWRRVHIDVPASATMPALPGIVDTNVSGRVAVLTTSAYSPHIHAVCEQAGITIREVQRMTLEEIFVANVMSNRRETQS
jgi:ABC-2 type transport system ATP-binding protein